MTLLWCWRAKSEGLCHAESAAGKIKLKFVSYFSGTARRRSPRHVCRAFHHNVTTKTPHESATFSETPLKKPSKIRKKLWLTIA
jgi:hypothetical protein